MAAPPPTGSAYPLDGIADPFTGWDGTLDDSQDHTASFLPTSSFLPPSEFPWFGPSSAPVDWVRPGAAPFEPHSGDWHLFSGQADVSYKRLTRTVDLTGATTGELQFFTSYETEADWDYLFVEAHEVGSDDVDDAAGRQRSHRHDTGQSCPAGWNELHPFLDHYQTAAPGLLADRHHRQLERGDRGLGRLRGVGRSTCPRTPASRSSCRSATSPTGGPRASGCSSMT